MHDNRAALPLLLLISAQSVDVCYELMYEFLFIRRDIQATWRAHLTDHNPRGVEKTVSSRALRDERMGLLTRILKVFSSSASVQA